MIQTSVIFFIFVLLHSVTVSSKFKSWCRDLAGDTAMRVYYRALYNVVSLVSAAVAYRCIRQVPDHSLWTAPVALRWALHGIQIAGIVFGALAFEHLDAGEFLGFRQLLRYWMRREVSGNIEGLSRNGLVTSGVYGIVRHPMYTAGIVIFTCNPNVTVNSLVLTVFADLYFLFGGFMEERRFSAVFGEDYDRYRLQVPRFIPRCRRRKMHNHGFPGR